MSCTLINGRTNPCNTISGIKRVYLFKYVQYLDTQIVCIPGSELISFPTSNIYGYECVNATFDETITNDDNGVSVNQSLSFTLKKQDAASTELLSSLLDFDVRFIVELNDGRYKIGGLYNGATVDNLTTVSGGAKQELNGYNITISANEEHTAPFVDDLNDFLLTPKTYNTYIGGVGASEITSESDLASMINIGINSIQNFTINANNDVACLITSEYDFIDKFTLFTSECTYFFDTEGYLENMVSQQFYNMPNGISAFLSPTLERLNFQDFDANFGVSPSNYIEYCVSPNAIFDIPTLDRNVFRSNSTNLNIYLNSFNETSNGGNPAVDLTARSYASINYQTNTNIPSKVASITVDSSTATTIDISWTAPSSSNSIDGYFVFQDNSYVGFTSTESYTLTTSVSVYVNIITLDNQGNTSGISNAINITTN